MRGFKLQQFAVTMLVAAGWIWFRLKYPEYAWSPAAKVLYAVVLGALVVGAVIARRRRRRTSQSGRGG